MRNTIRAFNSMRARLRRFNVDRTHMIAVISHDLRTPLTRVRLRAELVEDNVQQQKMLAEVDLMIKMVESLLSFARDDARHELQSLVDLSALVEGICLDASDADQSVTFSGPRGVTISCRPGVIRRAISNLVDNAVKYGGSADVSLVPEAGQVLVIVEDEGPGIQWTEREKVFEPFYRIGGSRDPNIGGVGLGLSVARSIVWEHGGDIVLANRKTGGLRVRLGLPYGTGHDEPEQQEHRPGGQTRDCELTAASD
jgi:signal transduction histidine kinase